MHVFPALLVLATLSAPGTSDNSKFYTQQIPSAPASGKLSGAQFKVTQAVLEADGMSSIQVGKSSDSVRPYKLRLHQVSEGGAKRTLYIRIQVDWDKRLDGSKISWRPYADGSPESNKQKLAGSGSARFDRGITKVEVTTQPEGGGPSRTEVFREKIALRLEFGQTKNGFLPGKILIALPDSAKSQIAGSFEAAYKVRHGTF